MSQKTIIKTYKKRKNEEIPIGSLVKINPDGTVTVAFGNAEHNNKNNGHDK